VDDEVYEMMNFAEVWQIADLEFVCDELLYHDGTVGYVPRAKKHLKEPKKGKVIFACLS